MIIPVTHTGRRLRYYFHRVSTIIDLHLQRFCRGVSALFFNLICISVTDRVLVFEILLHFYQDYVLLCMEYPSSYRLSFLSYTKCCRIRLSTHKCNARRHNNTLTKLIRTYLYRVCI
uniref:AlNc14C96G5886 protein n=1 Tax=Albugo laibachii Nc14 TaxID=890382 RepID=F0WH11_9STRA|nr:AlNc14C96G5886 [Albugo laibachii Nc14]|eukprot:CCA20526.1 AlNc14C96G5886 [Albugo laibachii Nc14]